MSVCPHSCQTVKTNVCLSTQLSETDEKVGEGIVKTNAGGGMFSKDLAVTKGEVVTILRMDGNPAGKWLAQNEQGKSE